MEEAARDRTGKTRIVVLGGGWAGVTAARELEKLFGNRRDASLTLVSRDNYFLITPLLFEACSGILELRHCSISIRESLRSTEFIEATVESVNFEKRVVYASAAGWDQLGAPYRVIVRGNERKSVFRDD